LSASVAAPMSACGVAAIRPVMFASELSKL
jgi:hypothetical protein